jgi:hypothetical protein
VGRRQRRRAREGAGPQGGPVATTDYTDAEGNVLTLRDKLPRGVEREQDPALGRPGASAEDAWQRHGEMLFERLAVSWTIAGLPITSQRELVARYRMADSETRRWVRGTIDDHIARLDR